MIYKNYLYIFTISILFILAFYNQEVIVLKNVGISLLDILFCLIVYLSICAIITNDSKLFISRKYHNYTFAFIILFWLSNLTSSFVHTDLLSLIKLSLLYIELVLIYFFLIKSFTKTYFLKFIYIFTYLLFFLAIYVVIVHIMHGYTYNFKELGALKLTFGFLTITSTVLYYVNRHRYNSFYFFILFTLSLLLLLISGEKKQWISFLISIIILVITWFYKHTSISHTNLYLPKIYFLEIFFISVIIISSIYLLQFNFLHEQIFILKDTIHNISKYGFSEFKYWGNQSVRAYIIYEAIQNLGNINLFGLGPGKFQEILISSAPSNVYNVNIHSEPLRYLLNFGPISFIIFIAIWIKLIIKSLFNYLHCHINHETIYAFTSLLSIYGFTLSLFINARVLILFLIIFISSILTVMSD